MQIPNLPNPYMQAIQPQQPQSYNAVKIDVHNPSVIAPGVAQAAPQTAQYAQPTMPYYQYPQAPVYQYPQAPIQPYYMPAQQPVVIPPQVTEQAPAALPQTPQAPQAPQAQAPAAEVAAAPVNVPQPVVTEKPAEKTEVSDAKNQKLNLRHRQNRKLI